MKRKYKSEPLEAIHESARDMYEIGLLSAERMRHFDEACLAPPVSRRAPRTSAQKSAAQAAHSPAPVYAHGK